MSYTLVLTINGKVRNRYSVTPEQVAVLHNTDGWEAEAELFKTITGRDINDFVCRDRGRWHISTEELMP